MWEITDTESFAQVYVEIEEELCKLASDEPLTMARLLCNNECFPT
jgi:hypothetical protein